MSNPFLGELKVFSFNFAPKGWALCNGQLLPVNQNQALFSILGTTYGGNGTTNFALPNLQGCVPIHFGNGFTLGQKGGEASHTLLQSEMPQHLHTVSGSSNAPDQNAPTNNFWATNADTYSATANTAMSSADLSNVGGNQAHLNLSPYLTLNICIALTGIFPSQN